MNHYRILSCVISLIASFTAVYAQTSLEEIIATPAKAGGIYYAYPVGDEGRQVTSAPEGYEPLYISH